MQNTLMHESLHTPGLCGTCRSALGCTFPRKVDVPVIECGEFEGESRTEHPAATRAQLRSPRDHGGADGLPGLCRWCDRQESCTFPRNAGGVWFCEEYQ